MPTDVHVPVVDATEKALEPQSPGAPATGTDVIPAAAPANHVQPESNSESGETSLPIEEAGLTTEASGISSPQRPSSPSTSPPQSGSPIELAQEKDSSQSHRVPAPVPPPASTRSSARGLVKFARKDEDPKYWSYDACVYIEKALEGYNGARLARLLKDLDAAMGFPEGVVSNLIILFHQKISDFVYYYRERLSSLIPPANRPLSNNGLRAIFIKFLLKPPIRINYSST